MPYPPETPLDDHAELQAQLRAGRPRPSEPLRERVRAIASVQPERRLLRDRLRGVSLVLVPVALVAAVGAAAVVGLRSTPTSDESASAPVELRAQSDDAADASAGAGEAVGPPAAAAEESRAAEVPAPADGRLQDYRAELRVRVTGVDELSSRTSEAMQTTRSLGGFVVRADFDAPEGPDGESRLVVRVPVARVQEAILRFSELGVIVSQRIEVEDLQATYDQQTRAVEALRRRVAELEEQLAQTGLTEMQRARLRAELAEARQNLGSRTRGREQTERQASLARIDLTLTTRGEAVVEQEAPGPFERRLRGALDALATTLSWILASLIVMSPFVALGGLALLWERQRRRRAELRLLERA